MAQSKESKVSDYFGTFLNTLNDRAVTVDSAASASATESVQPAAATDAAASGTSVLERPRCCAAGRRPTTVGRPGPARLGSRRAAPDPTACR